MYQFLSIRQQKFKMVALKIKKIALLFKVQSYIKFLSNY